VLLAPSVPLIMYAVIARVPITDMFLAGLLPAVVMVAVPAAGGGLSAADRGRQLPAGCGTPALAGACGGPGGLGGASGSWPRRWWRIGSMLAGLATPTESAALTAAYAWPRRRCAPRTGPGAAGRLPGRLRQLIGGVMLILGMALALTNFLVDAGIPDRRWTGCRARCPNRHALPAALCLFLFAAAALMEIYAAIVVLVPLLLPLARSYGIDPLHFGIIFLAAMEVGFLCPPAGMNLYFASAMFGKPIRYVAASVLPAMAAIFIGTGLLIAVLPGWPPGCRWCAMCRPAGTWPKRHVVACELGSLASVRQAADQVLQRSPRLRLLLNNAGMVSLRRERSMDGFERVFAVNHLGPFLLTERLRAALESGGRIVNVASSDHARGQLQLQAVLDPDAHPWRPRAAYARSKLANVLHAFALARRLQGSGVSAHALHPGVVHTQLLPRWLRAIKPLMSPGMLSAEQGARSSLHLALTPDVSALNGGYLDADQQPRAASRAAQDLGLQEALWAASWEWCGLSGGSG
jgi:NAD(P)-dependent dehydrogenase (short-subunit alcohol dehydrogenase family)